MSLETALRDFYDRHGFGETLGARPRCVPVYTGCLLVPLPNIETRHRYLKYHDLHHLITGFSVGRLGEGEISAWELGSGSMRVSPLLGLMNLIALSTGWLLDRKRMRIAYCRGCRSRNLYPAAQRALVDAGAWRDIHALREATLDIRPERAIGGLDRSIYAGYVALSLGVHATIAIPAVIARTLSDLRQGKPLRAVLKPSRRNDLY